MAQLRQMIDEKLKNVGASKELYYALRQPGARFMSFANGATMQTLKVLTDTDRGLTALDRLPAFNVEVMEGRHNIEKKLAVALDALVEVTADIALLANQYKQTGRDPVQIIDPNVKARMAKKLPAQASAGESQLKAA